MLRVYLFLQFPISIFYYKLISEVIYDKPANSLNPTCNNYRCSRPERAGNAVDCARGVEVYVYQDDERVLREGRGIIRSPTLGIENLRLMYVFYNYMSSYELAWPNVPLP